MYLKRLFQHSKIAFFTIIVLIGCQAFFIRKQSEQFPFLIYGMYSQKVSPKSDYKGIRIYYNYQPLLRSQYTDLEWEMLNTPLRTYFFKGANGAWTNSFRQFGIQWKQESEFKEWYQEYADDILGNSEDRISAVIVTYDHQIQIIDSLVVW